MRVLPKMPSGCVHGSSCAYLHEKVKPDAKAEATAKPKAQPKPKAKAMAAVAIVAALSSMSMPVEGRLELFDVPCVQGFAMQPGVWKTTAFSRYACA